MSNEITFRTVHVELEIPTAKIAYAKAKLEKINHRLAKLGAPAATLSLGDIRRVHETVNGIELRYDVQSCTLVGVEASIAGWTFVASLDHTVGEFENLVSRFPGHEDDELPIELRTAAPVCEHCGLQRTRNVTLILRNEAGELRQIGKACAAEYLGIDPSNALALASTVRSFGEDEDLYGWAPSEPPVEWFVAAAFECVRNFGFRRTNEDSATVDSVRLIAYGGKDGAEIIRAADDWSWERGFAEAAKAIQWAKTNDDTSDYAYNMRLAVSRIDVHAKTAGLLASLPTAWDRYTGKLAERAARKAAEEAAKANAQPVPVTDQRITITGTVVGVKSYPNNFSYYGGDTWKMIVLDDRGFKVIGGIPSSIPGAARNLIGKRLSFQAKVARSIDDAQFGKFLRPTKVELEAAPAA